MVRMPEEKQNNPLQRFTDFLKKKNNPAGEKETDAKQEEEKVKEIIKQKVIRH